MKKPYLIKFFSQSLLAMAMVMLAACGDDVPLASEEPAEEIEEPAEKPAEETSEPESELPFSPDFEACDKKINKAVNDFGMEIFRALINNDQLTAAFPNAAISPLSLSFALAMAANTFNNQFATEVLSKLQSDDLAQLNTYFRRLMADQPEGGELKLANSAWYFDGRIEPSKTYISNLAKAYTAPVNPIDFSNTEQAAALINGWVAENTDNLIEKIIEPKDLGFANVVLANALVFDCKWNYKFDVKLTEKDVFHGASGDTELDYLHTKQRFGYYESDKVKAISMPFEGGFHHLMVFIPNEGETISSVVENLDLGFTMSDYIVDLSIPKFSSELNDKCADLIESLGIQMKRLHTLYGFTGDKFTRYNDQISEVFHAAKMSINEEGALAASATVLDAITGMGPGSSYVPKEVTLKIDRPFFYLLCNRIQGSMIIAGCYTQP